MKALFWIEVSVLVLLMSACLLAGFVGRRRQGPLCYDSRSGGSMRRIEDKGG